MGELGQLLRQTREEKGLNFDQVANQTRIRVRFLEALEQEEYEVLPTPGHVHGFLRNYALYLGLDLDEVQALYAAGNRDGRLVPGIFRPKDIELAPRRPLVRASFVLGLVLFLVVLVVGGWALWQYGRPVIDPVLRLLTPAAARTADAMAIQAATTETAAAGTATAEALAADAATATRAAATAAARVAATNTAAAAEPTPTLDVVETPTAAPQATPTETPAPTATAASSARTATPTSAPTRTPTPSPTPVEGVRLSLAVIERAWLQVTLDGQEQPGELLEAGDERTWEADRSIRLVCGNAGGIQVTVNGQELGTLGDRAQVVERTWTPQGEATPTPAPS